MLRGFNSEDDDDVFVDPDAQNKVPSPSVPFIFYMIHVTFITRYWNNLSGKNSVEGPLVLKSLFVGLKTMYPSIH